MCFSDIKKTNFGLTPWKGEASLVNQAYIKPRKEADKTRKAAETAEQQRMARISENVGRINTAFGNREPQYQQVGDALRERLNKQLELQRGNATRQAKFSLARSGLTGGSVARDVGRNLNREGAEGVLQAERAAQQGVANLRNQDEQARTQLISLAQSGQDIGDAGFQAGNMLKANLDAANSDQLLNSLGEVFAGTATTYKGMQDAAARRRGLREAQTYGRSFSRE